MALLSSFQHHRSNIVAAHVHKHHKLYNFFAIPKRYPKQPSIWRPTSGQRRPLFPRRHLNHHLPICHNPRPPRVSHHNSALTRPRYEVCQDLSLPVSSLTNHKSLDRLSSDITRNYRRLDNTEPQCVTHACTPRIRPDIHQYEAAEFPRKDFTTRPVRPV